MKIAKFIISLTTSYLLSLSVFSGDTTGDRLEKSSTGHDMQTEKPSTDRNQGQRKDIVGQKRSIRPYGLF